MQRTADIWKKRYILEFYELIRSPEVYKKVRPVFKEYLREPTELKLVGMMTILDFFMDDMNMSEVTRKAVVSFYATAPLDLDEAVKQIEPITIKQTARGARLDVAKGVTQSDLLEFIKLKYAKTTQANAQRLNTKAKLREIVVVDRRVNKERSFKQIQNEISDIYNQWVDDSNLRTIVSNYQKRIK